MTAETIHALVLGLGAGLGVALPLGAIGVLLLREGIEHGWRPAAAGATGVALVDLTYAGLATIAGTAVTDLLGGHTRQVRLVGAAVLLLVALRGLASIRRSDAQVEGPTPPAHHALRRFVMLTAVNPLTAVYFVVLTAGLGDAVAGRGSAVAFVLGVFVGSWAWQLVLAGAGAFTGARLTTTARRVTVLVGNLVIIAYAARLAITA